MIDIHSYVRVLLSVAAGLLTLLGSVGIFVSLINQRRVERLQDILEEFMDLSYNEDVNLTGKMYKLIEKYQMHYLAPGRPGSIILSYINASILLVILIWVGALLFNFRLPWRFYYFYYLFPLIFGLLLLVFYRYLLRNALNPVGNSFLSPIIPHPTKLRSVSYLSKYINISVKSILKQARLRLVIKNTGEAGGVVLLKEELSFDDFFYYLSLSADDVPIFVGFGELVMAFPLEPITKKPVPAARNINIPLGQIDWTTLPDCPLTGNLLIFPRGEKHPISYIFTLARQQNICLVTKNPEVSINYLLTYKVQDNTLEFVDSQVPLAYYKELGPQFVLNKKRWACQAPSQKLQVQEITDSFYID